MDGGLRECPQCGTRVLPTAEDVCPACRKHRFGPDGDQPEVARESSSEAAVERCADLRRGARLYRNMLTLVAAQVVAVLVARAIEDLGAMLLVLGVSIATMITVYRLVGWLGSGTPLAWALGLAVPVVSVIILLVLTKRVVSEFERQGAKAGFFGPDPESFSVGLDARGRPTRR